MFADAFATRRTHPDDLALARRLLTHEDAEAIVAGLLRDHLGARPDALDEATAARRARTTNAEPPEPAPTPPRAESRREGRRPEGRGDERRDGPREDGPRGDERRDGPRQEGGRGDGPRTDVSRRDEPRHDGGRRDEPRRGDRSRRGERRREPPAARHATPLVPAGSDDNDDDLPGYVATPLPAEHAVAAPATSTLGGPSGTGSSSSTVGASAPSPANDDAEGADDVGEPAGEVSSNEIYVSVGRRDGAKPSDFQTVLSNAGIGPESTEYIRVRHRHAFVSVGVEKLDQALSALNGAVIAGRRANAERARRA